MTTTHELTRAAKRDLAAMRRGESVDLRYGPYVQLMSAGYIVGEQAAPRLVSEGSTTTAGETGTRSPRERRRGYAKAYNARNRERLAVQKQAHRKANQEKYRARAAVGRALQTGELVRPGACARCGVECRPEASHDDYVKRLEVEWLCVSCHRNKDGNNGGVWEPAPKILGTYDHCAACNEPGGRQTIVRRETQDGIILASYHTARTSRPACRDAFIAVASELELETLRLQESGAR